MDKVCDILGNILPVKGEFNELSIEDLIDDIFNIEVKDNRLCFWVSSPVVKMEIEKRSKDFLREMGRKEINSVVVFIGRDR